MKPQDSQIHFWVVAVVLPSPQRYPAARERSRPAGARRGAQPGGAETVPRQAASVIVLRGGDEALELLLVKRNPAGALHGRRLGVPGRRGRRPRGRGRRRRTASAAVRELDEEAGDRRRRPRRRWSSSRAGSRRPRSRSASTRTSSSRRCPDGAEPRDRRRASASTSAGSRRAARSTPTRAGEILLVFPTIKHLEQLAGFADAPTRCSRTPRPARSCRSQPRVVLRARPRASCCPASRATRNTMAAAR